MSSGHIHASPSSDNEKHLWTALALTSTFLVAEVIGGFMTGSLALLSDAAHMMTDASALGISLAAIRVAKRPADARRTFGYHRFEILAAAFNAMLLFLVAMYILYEASRNDRKSYLTSFNHFHFPLSKDRPTSGMSSLNLNWLSGTLISGVGQRMTVRWQCGPPIRHSFIDYFQVTDT